MPICLVEVARKFSYFLKYFSIFQNSKSIYLRYLKTFSKVINMFFEFIGCQIMSRNFLEFFEPLRYFSDNENDFSLFWKWFFNFKNRIITKNKRSSNPSNIYGWNPLIEPFPKFETPPSDSIWNSRNRLPKFGGGSNFGDNSGEQLLLIRAFSAESEGTATFVLLRASSWCLRFVDPIDGSSPIDDFVFGSGEGRLIRWASTILVPRFSLFFLPVQDLHLPPLPSSDGGSPSPLSPPPPAMAGLAPYAALLSPSPSHGWEEGEERR
jgi:hypothetical protein